jgi:hypothetical protein
METTDRSRDAQARCDGGAIEVLRDFPVGPLLDQAQNEQLALGVGEICERPKDGRGKRQAVIDGFEVGVHDGHWEAEAFPSAVLDPSLAQRRLKHVVSDAIEPRKCGALVLVSESLSAIPRRRKDLGGQIGAIVTHPDSRPGENPADVPVVELGKGVRIVQDQQLGVRLLRPRAHNLYMTAQRKMCHLIPRGLPSRQPFWTSEAMPPIAGSVGHRDSGHLGRLLRE